MAQEIDALLQESREFPPSEEFRRDANINDPAIWAKAAKDREKFWAGWAEQLDWHTKWDHVLEWNAPYAKWFIGGTLNASFNCLDRHLEKRGDKVALIWEGEPGEVRRITYSALHAEVSQVRERAEVPRRRERRSRRDLHAADPRGRRGHARVRAHRRDPLRRLRRLLRRRAEGPHPGRKRRSSCITATSGYRRGTIVPLKKTTDAAVADCPSIEHVVVVRRRPKTKSRCRKAATSGTTTLMATAEAWCEPEWVDSEHMLYVLYTSGSTGKPKGIIHTTGGYLTECLATTASGSSI